MRYVPRWLVAAALLMVCSAVALFSAGVVIQAMILLAEPDGFWRTFYCILRPECPPVVDCGWSGGCEILDFVIGGAVQAVSLAVVLAAILFAQRLRWHEDAPPARAWREGLRRHAIVWAFGVAVIALLDLAIYIVVWMRWAHCRVEHYQETFAFPTKQVVSGGLVAVTIAGAAIVLALSLRRRGLRHGDSGSSVSAEG